MYLWNAVSVAISSNEERACGSRNKALDQNTISYTATSTLEIARSLENTYGFPEISVNLASKHVELGRLSVYIRKPR